MSEATMPVGQEHVGTGPDHGAPLDIGGRRDLGLSSARRGAGTGQAAQGSCAGGACACGGH
ncbi:hypothetical protein [Georgenia yuyongxinii]